MATSNIQVSLVQGIRFVKVGGTTLSWHYFAAHIWPNLCLLRQCLNGKFPVCFFLSNGVIEESFTLPVATATILVISTRTVSFRAVILISSKAYDYCLTFSQELLFVWTSRWSLVRVLYVLNRYMPFIDTALVFYREYLALPFLQQKFTSSSRNMHL